MTTPVGPGGYPPGGTPPLGYQPPPGGKNPATKATIALVLAILGLCCIIFPIIGLILGLQSQKEIRASGNPNGAGIATAAVWVSIAFIALQVIYIILMLAGVVHNPMMNRGGTVTTP